MGLGNYEIRTSVAVASMPRARRFYEDQLGLSGVEYRDDSSYVYACGGGTALHVYTSAQHAGTRSATAATWLVDDVEQMVDELRSKGVTFEQYDEPLPKTDDKGIFTAGEFKVAWFKDPDGNIFAIEPK
jgi:catechol 2,3-dioxygenase-like lactoylglutathione lyase family enzyme